MSNVLSVRFDSFKNLIGNNGNRVYYFVGENFYDFHFVFEGFIVKTTLLKGDIENPQRFFSDAMFYNSMELTKNIPTPKQNLVELIQDEEVKNEDIQIEEVDTLPT